MSLKRTEAFLNKRHDFRYNEITNKTEFKLKHKKKFRELEEYDLNSLYRELHHNDIKIAKKKQLVKCVKKLGTFTKILLPLTMHQNQDPITTPKNAEYSSSII